MDTIDAPGDITDWDDHAPLLSTPRGALPAFSQHPPMRANRIPRIAAPRTSWCRRLYCALKARYLRLQLRHMRARLDQLEADMHDAACQAEALARYHRHSAKLEGQRVLLRLEHRTVAAEWLRVTREVDELEAQS